MEVSTETMPASAEPDATPTQLTSVIPAALVPIRATAVWAIVLIARMPAARQKSGIMIFANGYPLQPTPMISLANMARKRKGPSQRMALGR